MNFNGRHFLKECLNAVLSQSFRDFEIVFVDNGSSDGSLDFVKHEFDDARIKLIRSDNNLGFAGGNNIGFRHCKGEFTVLLNNDTIPDKDWLGSLVECIESHPSAGIVQSLVLTKGIPHEFYEMNGTINLLGHNIMKVFPIGQNGVGNIFQATGCSMIISTQLVREFGGLFPEEYFAYAEDTYLSFLVAFSGKTILHNSNSVVQHFGGGSSSKGSMYFYQERNRLLNFLIYFGKSFRVRYLFFLLLNFMMKFAASLTSDTYNLKGLFSAYIWLIGNRKKISLMRSQVEKFKKVSEDNVTGMLSGRVVDGKGILSKLLNSFSLLYCKIAGIRVIELR